MSKKSNLPRANRDIKASMVRLVSENGDMVGVVSFEEALKKAQATNLDLVAISPNVDPPVCKILDFGKFKYESKKRVQDSKKKQKTISLKEVKFRPNIGQSDFEVKVKNILRFLSHGDKVKVSLWFRGREITHNEVGRELFEKIIERIGEEGKLELAPKMEGKQMMMIFVPNK